MTYKKLAEYIMSLPAYTQEQQAYLEVDEGLSYSINEVTLGEIYEGRVCHCAYNTTTRQYVLIIDKKGTLVKTLKLL